MISWLQKNLFNTWFNSLLTFICAGLLYWCGSNLLWWSFHTAQWQVISANLRLFWVGRYPLELLWRAWLLLPSLAIAVGLTWGLCSRSSPFFSRWTILSLVILGVSCSLVIPLVSLKAGLILWGTLLFATMVAWGGHRFAQKYPKFSLWIPLVWVINFWLNLWLLLGGLGLTHTDLDEVSGLLLTLLVSVATIIISFPCGVLLALARQSQLPVIKGLAIAYIEIIRALPLVGLLFIAQVMIPLVLPTQWDFDRVIRAICGFVIFTSAYLAENVRGGLQSIPQGQYEAARAMGLNSAQMYGLVILPQALKAVIPAIAGQFISLLKNTTLLSIVSLGDLFGISKSILANSKYIGRHIEVYLFLACIYWFFCFLMSYLSQSLERQMTSEQSVKIS